MALHAIQTVVLRPIVKTTHSVASSTTGDGVPTERNTNKVVKLYYYHEVV